MLPADVPTLLLIFGSSLCAVAPFPKFTAFCISVGFRGLPFSSVAFLYLNPIEPVPEILIVP